MTSKSSSNEINNPGSDGSEKKFILDIKSDCSCTVTSAINKFKTCLSFLVSLLAINAAFW